MVERRPVATVTLAGLVCLCVWQLTSFPPSPPPMYLDSLPIPTADNETEETPGPLPPWDLNTLIDLTDFRFTTLGRPCNSSGPLLLILVHSAPGNGAKREAIRMTWGRARENVRLLFMLGSVAGLGERQLEEEAEEFGDLVRGNFIDAYRNMTYKHVMALKYATYYCAGARFVLKTDDDVFVNTPEVVKWVGRASPRRLLLCQVWKGSAVKRSWRSKWRVSFREYPDREYPTYCPGWAVLYSADVARALYREAQRSEYFWIDDVHVTGTLAGRLRLAHTPVQEFVLPAEKIEGLLATGEAATPGFLYASPDLPLGLIYRLWSVVGDSKVPSYTPPTVPK